MKRLLPKSEFVRSVLTLMTGTTIAQAIPIAIAPILTRLYTPEDFGVLALYMAVASMVSVVATARYELVIMLPKKDSDAANLVILSISIAFIVSFISFLIVFFFNQSITELLGNQEISDWLYFIPFTVLYTGIYQSLNYWNNRHKRYKNMAISRVVQSSVTASGQTVAGFNGLGDSGLVASAIIGLLSAMLCIYKRTVFCRFKFDALKTWALVKKYKKFPLFNGLNALMDSVRLSGIMFVISALFSTHILGQFSLAWRMTTAPIGLITSSLSQPFYQKLSVAPLSEAYQLALKLVLMLGKLSFFIYVALYFFAVPLFTFIFGESWRDAGEIVSILTPWLFLSFITSPLGHVYSITNRQDILLIVAFLYMLIPFSCFFLMRGGDFMVTLNIISILMSVFLCIYVCVTLLFIKSYQIKK